MRNASSPASSAKLTLSQRALAAGVALGDGGEANQPAPRRNRARRRAAGRRCPRRRRRTAAAPAARAAMAQSGAALRRAVELGEDEPGQPERIVERLHLRERVLAGVGVEHQQHLVRRAGERLGRDALHLADLLHQVQLRRQPARGVGDHHVDAARARRADRVEDHRAGIAATPARSPARCCARPRRRAARAPRRGRCRRRRAARSCPAAAASARACRSRWSCPSRSRRRP